jgi:methionyl-tRNA formyltransferase
MNVIIITQNDPFFQAENLDYFFQNLPNDVIITVCVLATALPFDRRESLLGRSPFGLIPRSLLR